MSSPFESDRSVLSALILPMVFGAVTAIAFDLLLPTDLRPPFVLTLLLALPITAGYERFVLFLLASLLTLNARWLLAPFLVAASLLWALVASLCLSLRGISWSASFMAGLWLIPVGASYAAVFIWLVRRDARA